MCDASEPQGLSPLEREICGELASGSGPLLLTGADLAVALGFDSANALNKAIRRGAVTVPLFRLPKRRGVFAWAPDVARMISSQRAAGLTQAG